MMGAFTSRIQTGTTVSVIDPATSTATPIDVGGRPISVAYNEATDRVFVTVSKPSDSDPDAYTLSVVELDPVLGTAAPVGDAYTVQPPAQGGNAEQYTWYSDMAVSPDGDHIYVTNLLDSTVTVMDSTTGNIDHTIAVPKGISQGGPIRIAFSPNGDHVYVVDQLGTISEISFADSAVNV